MRAVCQPESVAIQGLEARAGRRTILGPVSMRVDEGEHVLIVGAVLFAIGLYVMKEAMEILREARLEKRRPFHRSP